VKKMRAPGESAEERVAFWREKMNELRPTIEELQQQQRDYYEAYEIAKSELAEHAIPTATLAEVATGLATSEYPYRHDAYNPYDAACKRYSELLTDLFGDMAKWVQTWSATAFNRVSDDGKEGDYSVAPYPSLTITPCHADALETNYTAVVDSIMAFFEMFEDLPNEINLAVMTNDLSASGVLFIVMRDRENAELHKLVYGSDNLLRSGTLEEILQVLARDYWYGDPEVNDDDLSW
jgi:hypothetical protein